MKIHKLIRYRALAFTSALTLSLTSCNYANAKIEGCLPSTQLQEENVTEAPQNYIIEENIKVLVLGNFLSIQKLENEREIDSEALDTLYERINTMLVAYEINSIELYNLEDEIDLSKLHLENIRNLKLSQCSEYFDVSALNGKYQVIEFFNIPDTIAIEIIKNCDCSDAVVRCSNIIDKTLSYDGLCMDMNKFAHALVDNNIEVKGLRISQLAYAVGKSIGNKISLTEETIQTLCQVNTHLLTIDSIGNEDFINLNLVLNENIEMLRLDLPNYIENMETDIKNSELGTIKISAPKPLPIYFRYIDITENTHFELPDGCNVYFNDTEYTDITPFYDLRNASILMYKSPECLPIVYSENCDDFDETIEKIKQINESHKEKRYF